MSDGKVVTEFLYRPPESAKGTELRIPVRLVQKVDRVKVRVRDERSGLTVMKPGHTTSVEFRVVWDDPAIDLRGTDIEALRAAVFDKLDAARRVPWVPHLLVSVAARSVYASHGESFDVTYNEMDIARLPNGDVLRRERGPWRGSENVHKGLPWTGDDERGKTTSLIEATPGNVKALDAFIARLKQFREDVTAFLSPAKIEANLPNILGRLLPAPTTKGPTDDAPDPAASPDHGGRTAVGAVAGGDGPLPGGVRQRRAARHAAARHA